MEEHRKIKWHPGFYGALEFELRQYRDELTFESEHELSKEPLSMDMLIIKKNSDVVIDNAIGRLFRRHNIVEYKSPDDELSIDELYKVIAYACMYKSLGSRVNEIDARQMSISIFRSGRPRKLFSTLKELGCTATNVTAGVYYLSGLVNIPMQIVVTSELVDEEGFYALKIIRHNAREEDIRAFIREADAKDIIKGDRENIDAVLQVSVSANLDLYQKIRREAAMCEALRELMKDEIEKDIREREEQQYERGIEQGIAKGTLETLKGLVRDGLLELKVAAERANMTVDSFSAELSKAGTK